MSAQDKQRLAELAPFYVAGTLPQSEISEFEAAMAADPELARNVASARAERDEVCALNESLPAPGSRAAEKLFALIDAEPSRAPSLWTRLDLGARIAEFFSPRALGWVALSACMLVALEAGFLARPATGPGTGYNTASQHEDAAAQGRFALVAFAPDARVDRIADWLAQNGAAIVDGPRAGWFRVKLGGAEMSDAEADAKIESLNASGLVRFAQKAGR